MICPDGITAKRSLSPKGGHAGHFHPVVPPCKAIKVTLVFQSDLI